MGGDQNRGVAEMLARWLVTMGAAAVAVLVMTGMGACGRDQEGDQAVTEATTAAREAKQLATAAWYDQQETAEAATLAAMERDFYNGVATFEPTSEGRALFRVEDLLELADLVEELQS